MTLPYERTRAVVNTHDFLLELLDPKKTPRVPKAVRDQARHLLRHYPSEYEMDIISERESQHVLPYDMIPNQIFGKYWP
jgi:hypothetical protein